MISMVAKILFGFSLLLLLATHEVYSSSSNFQPQVPSLNTCLLERLLRIPSFRTTWHPSCYYFGGWAPEQCDTFGNCWCVTGNGMPLYFRSHKHGEVDCQDTLLLCDRNKNEEFRHCVSQCDSLCSDSTRPCAQTCVPTPQSFLCGRQGCHNRCGCPPGMSRNEYDACVDKSVCPIECVEKTMVFSQCAGCIVTCEERDNPPPCNTPCQEQCTCPEGTFLYNQRCVPPSQCPVPSTSPPTSSLPTTSTSASRCPANQVFSQCSGCDYRCVDRNNPPSCVADCKPRCTCPSDTYLLGERCVEEEECPAADPRCGDTMVYSTCGSCTPTCAQRGQLIVCTTECRVGCTCPDNTYLHEGKCVTENQCPPTCPPTQVYSECATCDMRCDQKDILVVCNLSCQQRCTCPDGKYLDGDRCVDKNECPSPTLEPVSFSTREATPSVQESTTSASAESSSVELEPNETMDIIEVAFTESTTSLSTSSTSAGVNSSTCPENQVFSQCAGCDYRCVDRNDPPACIAQCKPRCTCPFGTYLDGERCVTSEECPQPDSRCGDTMVYSTCGSCTPTCAQRGQLIVCTTECRVGCTCPDNTYLHEGKCVTENQCPPTCPPTQVYSECATCDMRCDQKDILVVCNLSCQQRCTCPDGKYLDGDRCVDKNECPSPTPEPVSSSTREATPSVQESTTSASAESSVELEPNEPMDIIEVASTESTTSLSTSSTSAGFNSSTCPENQVFSQCAGCDYRCVDRNDPPACIAQCKPRCTCPFGTYLDGERCVTSEECPLPDPRCGDTMVYSTCGSCTPTCAQRGQLIACTTDCRLGCTCPDNTYLHEGKCVTENQCPPTCPETQYYSECAGCDNLCENRNTLIPCPFICRQKCTCRHNEFLDGDRCVTRDKCPPICNSTLNEVLVDCAPPCDATCDELIRPCSLEDSCTRRCACTSGEVRDGNGVCVSESECIIAQRDLEATKELTNCQKGKLKDLPRLATDCDAEGYFNTTQCGAGDCYCVNKYSGKLLRGTERPKQEFDLDCAFLGDCPSDMSYSSCATTCPPTCGDPVPRCTRDCGIDCHCPKGKVRLSKTELVCVPIEECPTPHTCKYLRGLAAPEEIVQCTEKGDFMALQCNSSDVCWCVDDKGSKIPQSLGLYEDFIDQSVCDLARECNSDLGMVFNMCAPPCDATCSDLDKPCSQSSNCTSRCECMEHMVLDDTGLRCIPKKTCPTQPNVPDCGTELGEVFNDCASSCDATCADPYIPCSLAKICLPRCTCPPKWLRNDENECVPANDCPSPPQSSTSAPPTTTTLEAELEEANTERQCNIELGEVYSTCAAPCDSTCSEPFISCSLSKICSQRCSCPPRWRRNNENVCVPRSECPPFRPPPTFALATSPETDAIETPPCSTELGEGFNDCASSCDATCADPDIPCSLAKICLPRCTCPPKWLRNDENECVPANDCPSPPQSSTSAPIDETISSSPAEETGDISLSETHCQRVRRQRIASQHYDEFIPECDDNGQYESLQCDGFTLQCWCVNKDNGTELQGSKFGQFDLEDDVDCDSYVPNPRVTPEIHLPPSPPIDEESIGSPCNINLGEVFSACARACDATCEEPLISCSLPKVCRLRCACPPGWLRNNENICIPAEDCVGIFPSLRPRLIYPTNLDQDGTEPNTCATVRARKLIARLQDAFIPDCDEDSSYQSKQCYGFLNVCWCVNKTTGKELDGSRADRFNPDYNVDCDNYVVPENPPPEALDLNQPQLLSKLSIISTGYETEGTSPSPPTVNVTEPDVASPSLVAGRSEDNSNPPENVPEQNEVGSQTETCAIVRARKLIARLQDAFIPDCDEDGSYQSKQCYGFLNVCWCVNKTTGKELDGSRADRFNPDYNVDCDNYVVPPLPPTESELEAGLSSVSEIQTLPADDSNNEN